MKRTKSILKSTLLLLTLSLCFALSATTQESPKPNKKAKVVIKTNTYCDHCKKCESCAGKMESQLPYVKGIKHVEYNEEEMTISVVYNDSKITVEQIRKEISKLGYDADDVPADPQAYQKLDGCCKK